MRLNYVFYLGTNSGEVCSTFGHTNANFSVFIDRIRNQFLKKMNNDYDLNLHLHDQSRALRLNASRWSLSKFIVLKHFG